MFSRGDVERLWTESNINVLKDHLDKILREGRLCALIDRIDDHSPNLGVENDKIFWTTLAKLLVRPCDFASDFDERVNVARDATATIVSMAERNPQYKARVKLILDALIDMGDLTLAPGIIRDQLFAHGMTKHSSRVPGRSVLTQEEMQVYLDNEVARYGKALVDGTLLKRTVNLEALYVLINTHRYGPDLKAALTGQLNSLQSIATFATLVVPPGFSVERKWLEETFDTEVVKSRIDDFEDQIEDMDSWVKHSLQKLRTVLNA